MTTIATEEIERAEGLLNGYIKAAEMDVTLETEVDGAHLYFNLVGPDDNHFLGNKGEVLRGIAYLLQEYLECEFPKTDAEIKVDAHGAMREKEREIITQAEEAGKTLVESGDTVSIGPLNPYDRRLVHLALGDSEEYETESRGVGHFKKVIIRRR